MTTTLERDLSQSLFLLKVRNYQSATLRDIKGLMIMGMGRKKSVLKMKRKKSQTKFKNRIKRKIAEAKK